ncbi:MAG: hypothetical protein BMS9Abin05_2594 [Rhodothermia bacterium]|nr:MAG: hypothetical protein BMS9Abin05_2594 [Rhodothermia bacterium]
MPNAESRNSYSTVRKMKNRASKRSQKANRSRSSKGRTRRTTTEKGPHHVYYTEWDLSYANERIREGLPFLAVELLQKKLRIARSRLADILTISPRTLARRESRMRLTTDESDRLYRVARLFEIAESTLDGTENAEQWMKEENISLGGALPLEMAKTEPGSRLVEQILGRIEYGIPV